MANQIEYGLWTVAWSAHQISNWQERKDADTLLVRRRVNSESSPNGFLKDWTPQELWKAYIQPTEAEEAFRIQKHDLQLRPIWHQKENRVKAHISRSIIVYGNAGWRQRRSFVCFIAYVLWKSFAQICKGAGLGDEPRQVVEEIKDLTLTDVVLPTKEGIELRLRCVNKPDKHLAVLLHKLRMEPPLRLHQNQNL